MPALCGCAPQPPRLTLTHGPTPHTAVAVTGLSASQWQALQALPDDRAERSRLLRLELGPPNGAAPFMLGSHRLEHRSIVFEPEFPLQRGQAYRAIFDPSTLGEPDAQPLQLRFTVARLEQPAPRVVAVHPAGDRLPENLLKFYVHFSQAMQRGDVYRHVRLLDESDRVIELPFLELPEELWDPTGTRLTVLFDPGRVKRGLKPNEESGAVLIAGRRYTLEINGAWPDAQGRPIGSPYRKKFIAAPADRTQPDPKRWVLNPPASGTRQALAIRFNEALDRAMLEHTLIVRDTSGRALDGRIAIDEIETRWRFTPARPWQAGEHRVQVNTTLEDRAGNSIGRPFERDLSQAPATSAPPFVSLPFTPR